LTLALLLSACDDEPKPLPEPSEQTDNTDLAPDDDPPSDLDLSPDDEPDELADLEIEERQDERPDDATETPAELDEADEIEDQPSDDLDDEIEEDEELSEPDYHDEAEPNNGGSDADFNLIQSDWVMRAAIGTAGDIDIFRLQTRPGWVYRVRVEVQDEMQGHLTVFDDGRNGKPYADDYVKLALAEGNVALEWVAMGEGGYYIGVQDRRNVEGGSVGGPGFEYEVFIDELSVEAFGSQALLFPSDQQAALETPGALDLYTFEGSEGSEVLIDCSALQAGGEQGMDARLSIVSRVSGDWLARNDNRAFGELDPLIDAPLFGSGPMLLLVENVNEHANDLRYRLRAQ
jgi:hypothetical protein